jgi:hypothetical protein
VLVHGFFASAGVFRPMRARLEQDPGRHDSAQPRAPYGSHSNGRERAPDRA